MADSIFPFIDATVSDTITLPIETPREHAWNFEAGEFILENGKCKIVEGLEAVKIKIYKALITQRYRYLIYSWDYGSELEELIGQKYSKEFTNSEALRYIQDTLQTYFDKGWITSIKNFTTSFSDETLHITFDVVTPYGEANIHV